MSGLFSDLAARFAPGATASVRPRPAFRFEGDATAEGFEEVASQTIAPGMPPTAPPDYRQRQTAAEQHRAAPQSGVRDFPAPQPAPADARQQTMAHRAPPRDTTRNPAAPETSAHTRSAAPDTPADAMATPTTGSPTTSPPLHSATVETVSIPAPRPPGDPVARPESLPHAAISRSQPDKPDTAAPTEPPEAAPAPSALPDPTPTIRIGRIEVRAPAKPAAPAAPPRPAPAVKKPTARPAPAMAQPAGSRLTDYLGWKR